jgi:hypothetical protein
MMPLSSLKISHVLILGGVIGLLWVGVIVLFEPEKARQHAQNQERREMVQLLLDALVADRTDHEWILGNRKGSYQISTAKTATQCQEEICDVNGDGRSDVQLSADCIDGTPLEYDEHLEQLPVDPKGKFTEEKTGYFVTVDETTLTVGTCFGEGGPIDPLTVSMPL